MMSKMDLSHFVVSCHHLTTLFRWLVSSCHSSRYAKQLSFFFPLLKIVPFFIDLKLYSTTKTPHTKVSIYFSLCPLQEDCLGAISAGSVLRIIQGKQQRPRSYFWILFMGFVFRFEFPQTLFVTL